MVDITLLVLWSWFQTIAIRLAVFLAVLTLGPSVGLIVFDVIYYVFRTTYHQIPVFTDHEMDGKAHANVGLKSVEKSLHVRVQELERKVVE
jgi:hypothetical protein